MKKKATYQGAYRHLLTQFENNLQTLNYAKSTIKTDVRNVRSYLEYLETKQTDLKTTSTEILKSYFELLQIKTNQNTGTALSMSYLHKIKSAIRSFYEFLVLTQNGTEKGRSDYQIPVLPEIKRAPYKPAVLSKEEMQKLFATCEESQQSDLLSKRNKILLVLYYGCGLRRKEGVNLNTEDIDLDKGFVFVSKSKTNQQRNVPLNAKMQVMLEDYLFNVREKLIDKEQVENAVLVTQRGKRLCVDSVDGIIKQLVKDAKIKTKASTHTLRHSIATHLLEQGMKLESIALFLGHKTLDSTQIYTHLKQTGNGKI